MLSCFFFWFFCVFLGFFVFFGFLVLVGVFVFSFGFFFSFCLFFVLVGLFFCFLRLFLLGWGLCVGVVFCCGLLCLFFFGCCFAFCLVFFCGFCFLLCLVVCGWCCFWVCWRCLDLLVVLLVCLFIGEWFYFVVGFVFFIAFVGWLGVGVACFSFVFVLCFVCFVFG